MTSISATDNNDNLSGTQQNDLIFGLVGDDILSGGNGSDTLDGGADNDSLFGGNGTDTLIGGTGNDTLDGENGNDILIGGVGIDILYGRNGDDILFGGGSKDELYGGRGDDTFVVSRGTGSTTLDSADVIHDFGQGIDLIGLVGSLKFNDLNIFQGTGNNAGDTIITDKLTGKFLAILKGVNSNTIDTTDFIASPIANNGPVANGDTISTNEDKSVIIDVFNNDTDVDGDTLAVSAFDATSAQGGTIILIY